MQNGPPYEEHIEVAGLLLTSAVPPKSLTTAHRCACAPPAKVTDLIRSGVKPSQCAWSYESHVVSPGRQKLAGGLAKLDVCPISHTKEFGVSKTAPQPRALPICWVPNAGSSGPYWLFSTIVPERWVFRSVTWMNQPWDLEATKKCTRMVSPAFMTRGLWLWPAKSSALNAASSLKLPSGSCSTCQTGEHTVYLLVACTTLKPPSGVQLWTMASG